MTNTIRSNKIEAANDIKNIVDDAHTRTYRAIWKEDLIDVNERIFSSSLSRRTRHLGQIFPFELDAIDVKQIDSCKRLIVEIMSTNADNLIIFCGG